MKWNSEVSLGDLAKIAGLAAGAIVGGVSIYVAILLGQTDLRSDTRDNTRRIEALEDARRRSDEAEQKFEGVVSDKLEGIRERQGELKALLPTKR